MRLQESRGDGQWISSGQGLRAQGRDPPSEHGGCAGGETTVWTPVVKRSSNPTNVSLQGGPQRELGALGDGDLPPSITAGAPPGGGADGWGAHGNPCAFLSILL